MANFNYKAVDGHGRICRGRLAAHHLEDLEARLQRMGLMLIHGQPLRHRGLFSSPLPRRTLIHFCFHLEQMLRAGVPILESLTDLQDSLETSRWREVIASLVAGIEGGATLSQAMAQHGGEFPATVVSLVEAGELSGQLPEVLHRLAEALKWEDEVAAHTRQLLLYPAFVGIIVAGAVAFLMATLVPQLKQFVQQMGQDLPLHTQALFYIADLVAHYGLPALLLAIAGLALWHHLLSLRPALRQTVDAYKLGLPLLGPILKKLILSRFANHFALLYASGIPILDALQACREIVGNRAIGQGLEAVAQGIGEGLNLTAAFQATGLFPPLMIRMLRIGERTGDLDTALQNIHYFFTRDVKESVGRLQALAEPTLTLILGALLGWIMLAVLGPIYDIISRVKV